MIHILIRLLLALLLLVASIVKGQETWTLQDCLDYTLQNHPSIKQTAIAANSSEWELKQSKANLLPTVNADINHSYSLGSTINPNTNVREPLNVQYDQLTMTAGIDLFDWQNYLNIKLQKTRRGSFVYRLEATKNQIILGVVQNFYAYQNAKAWREVLESQLSGIDDQISRTEKEVEIGIRPKSDIYDIKANMGNIQEQYIEAEKQVKSSKLNLLQSMNLQDKGVEFDLKDDALALLNFSTEDLAHIVEKQPQIQTIQKEIEAAEQLVRLKKAGALPKLTGVYQWSTFYSKILNSDEATPFTDQLDINKNQYIGIGLQIPIFNKLQVKTQTELAINDKEYQVLILEKEKQATWTAIQQIVNAYEKSVEKYEYIKGNFINQKLSFERSQEKFNEGLIDAYTFFMIRNNWLNANYNIIQSKNEVLMQQALLKVFWVK
ncbi:MAG: TolC family protein [Weeksellaceae bacterium]